MSTIMGDLELQKMHLAEFLAAVGGDLSSDPPASFCQHMPGSAPLQSRNHRNAE